MAYDPQGLRYQRLIVRLKPTKTDPTGEEHWEMSFRIDRDPDSLSAGAAIAAMLSGDDNSPDAHLDDIPLFRDPSTGREVSYEESRDALATHLRSGGYEELASGLHSLRIGGATALASDPCGGEFVAGCAGLWTSDCKYRYIYALREKIEAASYSAGRRSAGSLARRPGPLSAC